MGQTVKKVFLLTTETSGDLLAGELIRHLVDGDNELRVCGVGGPKARAQGMRTFYTVEDFNVMGLVEVLGNLKRLKRQFNDLVHACEAESPDVIVLVDAPDFNIRFAKAVRHLGIPIVYYVSPQVWAWRSSRAKHIASVVDHMMVLFSFEADIYRDFGLKTTWVGHPLVDEIPCGSSPSQMPERDVKRVLLAPGSRPSELERHRSVYEDLVQSADSDIHFSMALAPALKGTDLGALAKSDRVDIVHGNMRVAINDVDAAVVASGTATLETGLFGVPMVVGYRMNALTYHLAKRLVKVDHIALVNIVLNDRVVPELIQDEFNAKTIWKHLRPLLGPTAEAKQMREQFARLPELLGGTGSGRRAAEVVRTYL